jgi:hypothetical protein
MAALDRCSDIKQAYEYARNHKQYMDARTITVHDLYAFDPNMKVSLDPFIDIIGATLSSPKKGWGTTIAPSRTCGGHSSSRTTRSKPPTFSTMVDAGG